MLDPISWLKWVRKWELNELGESKSTSMGFNIVRFTCIGPATAMSMTWVGVTTVFLTLAREKLVIRSEVRLPALELPVG